MRFLVWIYGRGWLAIIFPFVRFRRFGFENLSNTLPCIFVVNHLSFFDTYFMALLPVSDVVFAVRAWPFKMVWYAPFMRLARYLDVETLRWQEVVNRSQKLIDRHCAILFFPEGHRSRDGKLGRFYSGGFKVSVETGVPMVPLCISGSNRLLPPGRWWLEPAKVSLKVLKPVDPSTFSGPTPHIEMRKTVKSMMAESLAEMR
jgi:1-acyl-sn-glycerol-3-phosphate acyltransferase